MKIKLTKKKKITAGVLLLLLGLFIGWVLWANTALEVNTVTITEENLPEAFDGYRIAHISDLHDANIGKDNSKLLNALKESKPDIIVFTGDMIDSNRTDVEHTLRFAEKAAGIATCYYVPGNHESRIPEDYEKLKAGLRGAGVIILENDTAEIQKDGEIIRIAGVMDPAFDAAADLSVYPDLMRSLLSAFPDTDEYTVLLSHRPELFEVYCEESFDLVLTGHAHGGQARLPFIGAVYVPSQGWFPKYTEGVYTEGVTDMVISRGIGNSTIPLRFNNRPELILIELKTK